MPKKGVTCSSRSARRATCFQSTGEVPQMNCGAVPEAAVEEWVWASGRFIVA